MKLTLVAFSLFFIVQVANALYARWTTPPPQWTTPSRHRWRAPARSHWTTPPSRTRWRAQPRAHFRAPSHTQWTTPPSRRAPSRIRWRAPSHTQWTTPATRTQWTTPPRTRSRAPPARRQWTTPLPDIQQWMKPETKDVPKTNWMVVGKDKPNAITGTFKELEVVDDLGDYEDFGIESFYDSYDDIVKRDISTETNHGGKSGISKSRPRYRRQVDMQMGPNSRVQRAAYIPVHTRNNVVRNADFDKMLDPNNRKLKYGFPKGSTKDTVCPSKILLNPKMTAGDLIEKMVSGCVEGGHHWNCGLHQLFGLKTSFQRKYDSMQGHPDQYLFDMKGVSMEDLTVCYFFLACLKRKGDAPFCPKPCWWRPCETKEYTQTEDCRPYMYGVFENDYICKCKAGHAWDQTLNQCQERDVCGERRCVKGNTKQCNEIGDGVACECKSQFTGTRCEQSLDACLEPRDSAPRGADACGPRGTCNAVLGSRYYTCRCQRGWTDDPGTAYPDCKETVPQKTPLKAYRRRAGVCPGKNLASIHVGLHQCAAACSTNTSCRSFSFLIKAPHFWKHPRCWLRGNHCVRMIPMKHRLLEMVTFEKP